MCGTTTNTRIFFQNNSRTKSKPEFKEQLIAQSDVNYFELDLIFTTGTERKI
jgi:hypothetical protein